MSDSSEFNPYSASTLELEASPPRKVSWMRGSAWAGPCGAAGFAVPYAVATSLTLARYFFSSYSWHDVVADFHEIPQKYLAAGIGCAFVFALAAFLNFTPEKRIGYVRALMLVGLVTLAGLFAVSFVLYFLPRQVYQSRGEEVNAASWIPTILILGIPSLYVVAHVLWISRQIRAPGEIKTPEKSSRA